MFVHKLLRGIGAEKYLPFALARLRALEKIFGAQGYFTQKFEDKGYKISVRQIPPFQYVDITGGVNPRFEWFASDHVDGYLYATPGYRFWEVPADQTVHGFGYVVGQGIRVTFEPMNEKGKTKVKVKKPNPLFSHTFPPEGDPPKWATKSIYDVYVPLNTKSKDFFKLWSVWQMQYIAEYQWFPKNKPDEVLISCWGAACGRLSLMGWGDYHWADIIGGFFPPYDVVIDVSPTLYDTSNKVMGTFSPYLGQNCWPRRGAMQEVKHEQYGKRRYFILGDNKGRLIVYPVKMYWSDPKYYMYLVEVYGLLGGVSRTIEYKAVTPKYPSWVSLSPVEKLDVLLWWNWTFNSDATKAATIALHDEVRKGYYFYTDPSIVSDPDFYITEKKGFLDRQFNDDPHYPALFGTSKKGASPRVLTPGLVEISIKIELTGPEEMDFEVEVEVLKSDYFGNSGHYYQDAAYLYDDDRLKKQGFHEDLLVTSEIQAYTEDGLWYNRYIATQEGDEQDNPPFHFHFETNLDLNPDADPPYYYIWRGDPDGFTEGLDRVGNDVTSAFVIRRQDTGAEIRRHALGYKTTIADWEFPDGNNLVFKGPNGRPTSRTVEIPGIWMHAQYWRANEHFERNGPNTGPDRGTYAYGGMLHVDLRSLSYTVFHANSTFTGYRIPNSENSEIKWRSTNEVQRHQADYYIFGEYKTTTLSDLFYVYPDYYRYGGRTATHYLNVPLSEAYSFPEPPPEQRVTVSKEATMIYGSLSINFMIMTAYDPIISHPRGHYSLAAGKTDYLSFRTANKDDTFTDTVTTHKEMFNKAFNQNRDYLYYDGAGSLGPEVGDFRLAGLWLPYPDERKKEDQ